MLHEHGSAIKIPDALLTADRKRLRDDVVFWLTADGTEPDNGFHLEFPAGDVPGNDLVGVASKSDEAFVNLGLVPYFRNTVVFDVEPGLVGFAPSS